MKNFLFAAALLACATLPLPAQEKGATPVSSAAQRPAAGVTRAVVIGISDYKDERITDLQYAHRDAEAFVEWLRSPAGGTLPEEQINLLTNAQATLGKMVAAFDWLINKSKPGDRALIYFSGHGDVETLTSFNRGYLLAHDAPGTTYMAGGALNLLILQDIISTLSGKGVQVVMISDACRAGKLAGSETGGSHTTTAELAKAFAHEIKILSCQPEEFSLEGEQWGGGRGCFSYHLTEGLTGLADGDANMTVELREIGRYLQDRVSAEADPHRQLPMTVGSPYTLLAQVDKPSLDDLLIRKGQEKPGLMATKSKGTDDLLLANADSTVQAIYQAFVAAMERGELLASVPAGNAANDHFEQLMQRPGIEDLKGVVKRNFAAVLQDEAQLVINKLLRTDPKIADDVFPGRVRYAHLPAYLARATEILGPQHYLYRYLKAKQYFFEAKTYTKAQYPGLSPDSLFRLSNEALDKGLAYDPEAAFIHLEKGVQYFWNVQPDVAAEAFDKALKLSPTWVLAIYYYARAIDFTGDRPKAVHYLKEALRYDSSFLPVYERLGYFTSGSVQIYWRNEYVRRFKQWEERDSTAIPPVYMRYMGLTLHYLGQNEEAEKYLLRGAEMTNWEDPLYYKQLCFVYNVQERYTDMCRYINKYAELMPFDNDAIYYLLKCKDSPKLRRRTEQYHQNTCVKNDVGLCWLHWYYLYAHYFDDSKKIGQEHIELVKQDTVSELPWLARCYWYYGSASLAESTLLKHVRLVEASGDSIAKAALKNKFGPFGQLVMANLAQGDAAEAEYWFDRKDRMDESFNPEFSDGWGFGLQTWLAYAKGNYAEADALIADRSSEVPAGDIVEDMLLIISICGQVDYAIFCLDKALRHYPDRAELPYHLARLYLEQKNDYAKGVPLLERAVLLDKGSHAPAHYHLAASYAYLGKNDAALEHLEKALELGYDYEEGIGADARWERLRSTERYRAVMGRYFGKN